VTHDHALTPGWHHLAGVRKSGELLLYVDGREVSRTRLPEDRQFDVDTDQPLRIGHGQHDVLRGRLKDVRLYRGALSAEEIGGLATSK
jgi:hypothetical protein